MRSFDASDEHNRELRSDLAGTGQKFDAHAISINHLELQMDQFSSTVNPRLLGTLPNNIVQNPKTDGHCMEVTTRGGRQTIEPPMLSGVENLIRGDDEVVEVSGDLEDNTRKEDEVPQKVTLIPRPPQRLVKKIKDGKYRHFIAMIK